MALSSCYCELCQYCLVGNFWGRKVSWIGEE